MRNHGVTTASPSRCLTEETYNNNILVNASSSPITNTELIMNTSLSRTSPSPSIKSISSSAESAGRVAAPQVSPAAPPPPPSSSLYRRNSLNFVVGRTGSSNRPGGGGGNGRIASRRLSCASTTSTNTTDTTKSNRNTNNTPAAKSFPEKLMEMIDAASNGTAEEQNDCIRWLPHGNSFTITDPEKFTKEVLPRHFKKTQYRSFTRKLYRWGFRQITKGPDAGSYFHEHFRRDQRTLAHNMNCHYSEKELLLQKESSAARRRASMDGTGGPSAVRRRATAPGQRVAARRSSISEVCSPGAEDEDDDAVMRQIEAAAAAMRGEEEDGGIIVGSLAGGAFADSAASGAIISGTSADGGLGNLLGAGRAPKRGSIYSLRSSFSSVGSVLTTQQPAPAAATASTLLPLDGDSIPSGGADLNSTTAIGGLGVPTIIETSSLNNSFAAPLDVSAAAIAPGVSNVIDTLPSGPLHMTNDFRQTNIAPASFLQHPQRDKLTSQIAISAEDTTSSTDLDPLFSQPLQHQSQVPNNNTNINFTSLPPNPTTDRNIMQTEHIAALTGLQPQAIDAAGGIANLPASVASGLAELNRLQEQINTIQKAIASGSRQMQMHGLHANSLQQHQQHLLPNTTSTMEHQLQPATISTAPPQQQQLQHQAQFQLQQQTPKDMVDGDSLSVLNLNQNNSANLSGVGPAGLASISSSLDGSLPDFGMGHVSAATNSDGVASASSISGTGGGSAFDEILLS